jgi:hypothetical protein
VPPPPPPPESTPRSWRTAWTGRPSRTCCAEQRRQGRGSRGGAPASSTPIAAWATGVALYAARKRIKEQLDRMRLELAELKEKVSEEAANRSTAAERGAMDRPRRLWDHTAENLLR